MNIAFQTNQLSLRGTEVALYDYAHFNEELLGHNSIVLCKTKHTFPHDKLAVDKFQNRFPVHYYNNWEHAERILQENQIDILYTIKAGVKDEVLSKNCKTVVHVVFQMFQPHGDVYAYVSEWLSQTMTQGKYPFVPHMINLPEVEGDLRTELGIPKDAIVFGRHGGHTTFNLPFAFTAVNEIVKKRKDIYFLFLHTDRTCENFRHFALMKHPQIIHIPAISDLEEKVKFINTCDAMLHARVNGESFGLAVGEFSIKNKPVITWTGKDVQRYYPHKYDRAYYSILGNKGLYYNDYKELMDIILNFKSSPNQNWDAYSDKYNPLSVMTQFKKVFID